MEIQFLGTSAGQPSKSRNVSCTALKLLDELNEVWLFDVGEATQHQIVQYQLVHKLLVDHHRLEKNEMRENLEVQKYGHHEYVK